jgi:hypothetical protein
VASAGCSGNIDNLNVNTANIMHQLRLLLLEGCYAGSVTGFIDLLHFANQIAATKAGRNRFTGAVQPGRPSRDHGLRHCAEPGGRPELADAADTLVLPPISYRRLSDFETRLMAEQTTGALATRLHAAGRRVMSFCTGVPLAGRARLAGWPRGDCQLVAASLVSSALPQVLLQDYATCSEADGIWWRRHHLLYRPGLAPDPA